MFDESPCHVSTLCSKTIQGEVVFLYIAHYPVTWTAQSALHVTHGRPVHFDTNSTSLGSILATQQLLDEDQYLFMKLSEPGSRGEDETVAKGDSNMGSESLLRVRQSTALHINTHNHQNMVPS